MNWRSIVTYEEASTLPGDGHSIGTRGPVVRAGRALSPVPADAPFLVEGAVDGRSPPRYALCAVLVPGVVLLTWQATGFTGYWLSCPPGEETCGPRPGCAGGA
jgi:hypothetical protein